MRLFHQTEQDLEDILPMPSIDVRVLGVEYKDRDFTGKSICQKRSIDRTLIKEIQIQQ